MLCFEIKFVIGGLESIVKIGQTFLPVRFERSILSRKCAGCYFWGYWCAIAAVAIKQPGLGTGHPFTIPQMNQVLTNFSFVISVLFMYFTTMSLISLFDGIYSADKATKDKWNAGVRINIPLRKCPHKRGSCLSDCRYSYNNRHLYRCINFSASSYLPFQINNCHHSGFCFSFFSDFCSHLKQKFSFCASLYVSFITGILKYFLIKNQYISFPLPYIFFNFI